MKLLYFYISQISINQIYITISIIVIYQFSQTQTLNPKQQQYHITVKEINQKPGSICSTSWFPLFFLILYLFLFLLLHSLLLLILLYSFLYYIYLYFFPPHRQQIV